MTIPGFTGENSIRNTRTPFQSEADQRFGRQQQDNQVYLQKPNHMNRPGNKCQVEFGDGPISYGTYNHHGYCCLTPFPDPHKTEVNVPPICVDCDQFSDICSDTRPPLPTGGIATWDDSQQVFDGSIAPSPRPRWEIPTRTPSPRVRF